MRANCDADLRVCGEHIGEFQIDLIQARVSRGYARVIDVLGRTRAAVQQDLQLGSIKNSRRGQWDAPGRTVRHGPAQTGGEQDDHFASGCRRVPENETAVGMFSKCEVAVEFEKPRRRLCQSE